MGVVVGYSGALLHLLLVGVGDVLHKIRGFLVGEAGDCIERENSSHTLTLLKIILLDDLAFWVVKKALTSNLTLFVVLNAALYRHYKESRLITLRVYFLSIKEYFEFSGIQQLLKLYT